MSIEEKVLKRSDNETKISTKVTEEEIRITPPNGMPEEARRKSSLKSDRQRFEDKKLKKEERRKKSSKEENSRLRSLTEI